MTKEHVCRYLERQPDGSYFCGGCLETYNLVRAVEPTPRLHHDLSLEALKYYLLQIFPDDRPGSCRLGHGLYATQLYRLFHTLIDQMGNTAEPSGWPCKDGHDEKVVAIPNGKVYYCKGCHQCRYTITGNTGEQKSALDEMVRLSEEAGLYDEPAGIDQRFAKLSKLSMAMGNPALDWTGQSSIEDALIEEACRRLAARTKENP